MQSGGAAPRMLRSRSCWVSARDQGRGDLCTLLPRNSACESISLSMGMVRMWNCTVKLTRPGDFKRPVLGCIDADFQKLKATKNSSESSWRYLQDLRAIAPLRPQHFSKIHKKVRMYEFFFSNDFRIRWNFAIVVQNSPSTMEQLRDFSKLGVQN